MSTAAAAATPSDKQNLSPSQLNAVARRCPNLDELILQVRMREVVSNDINAIVLIK